MTTLFPRSNYDIRTPAPPPPRQEPPPSSLMQAVQMAVRQIDEHALEPVDACRSTIAFQPKVLLALLTVCYARQIYASSAIQAYMVGDEAFCWLCGRQVPTPAQIRAFRDRCQTALLACLGSVLHFLAAQKAAAGVIRQANQALAMTEAKRRLTMAAFTDCLELDATRC